MMRSILSFLALITVLSILSSCKKDFIDVSDLSGKWAVKPLAAPGNVDGLMFYTFSQDRSYSVEIIDFLAGNEWTHTGTYILSNMNKRITLYNNDTKEEISFEVIEMRKDYMNWRPLDKQNSSNLELDKIR